MTDLVEELDRLAHLADNLLLLAAAEGQAGLEREPVEVEDLLVSAVRRWSRTAPRSWQIDVMSEGVLHADRERLDAALDAIFENAVHATVDGEVIAVLGQADGDVAVIELADGGIGILEKHIPRVFDRFWSTGYGPDHRRGTGLGLPIVRAIVEAHGGSVSVRSTGARGTVVAVRLPGLVPAANGDGSPALRHPERGVHPA
jgi:signal transduction histidine kinase